MGYQANNSFLYIFLVGKQSQLPKMPSIPMACRMAPEMLHPKNSALEHSDGRLPAKRGREPSTLPDDGRVVHTCHHVQFFFQLLFLESID